jgi:pyridoxamine 5'-phosphate oxidase
VSEPPVEGRPVADLPYLRRSYGGGELTEAGLAGTWLEQLQRWYDEAAAVPEILDPNAMQIATVDQGGMPDIRTVLARGFDESGIVFYTNYESAKGNQLATNPRAAGLFAWLALERQVRFRGPVTPVSRRETEAYFASRPRGAQLGAWASPQSRVIGGRDELENRLAEVTRQFGDETVPPPDFWGGYRIEVSEIEFWQGREYRLHDRLRFRRVPDSGDWCVERLAP